MLQLTAQCTTRTAAAVGRQTATRARATAAIAAAQPDFPSAAASTMQARRAATTTIAQRARTTTTTPRRHFASNATGSTMNVFDRSMKLAQRRNAALDPNFAFYHYLRDEVASRLVDRLADINKAFPVVAEIGCGTGAHVSKLLKPLTAPAGGVTPASMAGVAATTPASDDAPPMPSSVANRGVIKTLHLCDSSPEALARTQKYWAAHADAIPSERSHEYHVVNEECALPFAPGSVDLIVSNMSMHWINDLPGFLKQCRTVLKPDGVFLASMLGGATLQEMRSAFTVADMERLGGVNAHVSPFVYGRDCGDLMAAAGFSMPTIDTDVLTMRYPDLFTLMAHLQSMGESGCGHQRPPAVSRDVFVSAAAAYESLYADEEGLLPATFQVFYMIGWAPHTSQPKALKRGTATAKLADLDKVAATQEEAAPFVQ